MGCNFYFKGDDTGFGGNVAVKIYKPVGTENINITKAIFHYGKFSREYINPVFPIEENFVSSETINFPDQLVCWLEVWDENDLHVLCKGTIVIPFLERE